MIEEIFKVLSIVDEFYWGYVGFFLLIAAGLYLSTKSGFYQLRVLKHLPSSLKKMVAEAKEDTPGVSPVKLYFASIGGMIGLGNISSVIIALTIGGPGALFWLWVAAFLGMIIKYSEIYIGMKYRQSNNQGGYDGGPMYNLKAAFPGALGAFLAGLAAFALCIYGVEVYQFTVIANTFEGLVPVNREIIIWSMLLFTLYMGTGGVKRLANFCTALMPAFMVLYVVLCLWVVGLHLAEVPSLLVSIVKGAFVGHAPIGGFLGSTFLMVAQQGASKAVYSGDIAIGFDSIIQSETKLKNPVRQARMAIIASFSDALICTLSILVVMLSGLWIEQPVGLDTSEYVSKALSAYFPAMPYIVPLIIFLAGFTTIQAYFAVGIKAAKHLGGNTRWGTLLYFLYAVWAFWFFAHFDQEKVMIIMSLSGGLLILLNIVGIIKLSRHIDFKLLADDKI